MNVLVADSDVTIINQMTNQLSSSKLLVLGATSSDAALQILQTKSIGVCFLQFGLEPYNACDLTQIIREHSINGIEPGIIISISNNLTGQEQAILKDLGQIQVIRKPINLPTVRSFIAKAQKIQKRRQALLQIKNSVIHPLIAAGRHSEASTLIQSHLLGTGQEDATMIALSLLREMGDWNKALKISKELHDKHPNSTRYMTEVGEALAGLEDFNAALRYTEKANRLAPSNYKRIRSLADWYAQCGLEEESAEKYQEAIALRKADEDLKFSIYEEILASGREQLAIRVCKKTAKQTEITRHYNNAGIQFSKLGKYLEAIAEYKKGYELVTDRKAKRSLLYNMAIAHLNLKNRKHYQLAKGLLKKALEIDPQFQKATDKLAETNKRLGITKESA